MSTTHAKIADVYRLRSDHPRCTLSAEGRTQAVFIFVLIIGAFVIGVRVDPASVIGAFSVT